MWMVRHNTPKSTRTIDIYGLNRSGLLNDVFCRFCPIPPKISTVNAQRPDMKFANIHVSFGIANLSMLTTVVDRLRACQRSTRSSGLMADSFRKSLSSCKLPLVTCLNQRKRYENSDSARERAQVSIDQQLHSSIGKVFCS